MICTHRIIFSCVFIVSVVFNQCGGQKEAVNSNVSEESEKFFPLGPKVRCDYLSMDFLDCDPLKDLSKKNLTDTKTEHGCQRVRFLLVI